MNSELPQDLVQKVLELRQELAKAREDSMMLDWQESTCNLEHIYEEGRPETTAPIIRLSKSADFDFDNLTIRQVIKTAMQTESEKERKG